MDYPFGSSNIREDAFPLMLADLEPRTKVRALLEGVAEFVSRATELMASVNAMPMPDCGWISVDPKKRVQQRWRRGDGSPGANALNLGRFNKLVVKVGYCFAEAIKAAEQGRWEGDDVTANVHLCTAFADLMEECEKLVRPLLQLEQLRMLLGPTLSMCRRDAIREAAAETAERAAAEAAPADVAERAAATAARVRADAAVALAGGATPTEAMLQAALQEHMRTLREPVTVSVAAVAQAAKACEECLAELAQMLDGTNPNSATAKFMPIHQCLLQNLGILLSPSGPDGGSHSQVQKALLGEIRQWDFGLRTRKQDVHGCVAHQVAETLVDSSMSVSGQSIRRRSLAIVLPLASLLPEQRTAGRQDAAARQAAALMLA
jgi:hypothetical protein